MPSTSTHTNSPASADRSREHGAFANARGQPSRINAACDLHQPEPQLPEPTGYTDTETQQVPWEVHGGTNAGATRTRWLPALDVR